MRNWALKDPPMNHEGPANEPVIDRPPTTADVTLPTEGAEVVSKTRIGRFELGTATLRAYTMLVALVVIWIFLQWATISADHPYGLFLDPVNFSKLLKQTRSEEHTSELQSQSNLVCRLLLEKKKKI